MKRPWESDVEHEREWIEALNAVKAERDRMAERVERLRSYIAQAGALHLDNGPARDLLDRALRAD